MAPTSCPSIRSCRVFELCMSGSTKCHVSRAAGGELHPELAHERGPIEIEPGLADQVTLDFVDGDHRQLNLLVGRREAELRTDVLALENELEHACSGLGIRDDACDLRAGRRKGIVIEDLKQALDLLLAFMNLTERQHAVLGVVRKVLRNVVPFPESFSYLAHARGRLRAHRSLRHRLSSRLSSRLQRPPAPRGDGNSHSVPRQVSGRSASASLHAAPWSPHQPPWSQSAHTGPTVRVPRLAR